MTLRCSRHAGAVASSSKQRSARSGDQALALSPTGQPGPDLKSAQVVANSRLVRGAIGA